MKSAIRTIVRRKLDAARRLRRPLHQARTQESTLQPLLDDPMELGSELVDLTTGELVFATRKRTR